MAKKNIPVMKKKVAELIKELQLTPAEALLALEPVCERLRKESRESIEKDVADFKKKAGIPNIKTDY